MKLDILLLWLRGLLALLTALESIDRAVSKIPVAGGLRDRARDAALDRLLGPAEDFDYVSRTAPATPPPTYPD